MKPEEQKKFAFEEAYNIASKLEQMAYETNYKQKCYFKNLYVENQIGRGTVYDIQILLMRMGYECNVELSERVTLGGYTFPEFKEYELLALKRPGRRMRYRNGLEI